MAKIRGDPIRLALAHPTRHALYQQLADSDEMSTVQLCKAVGIERYHLYHHLKHLSNIGLIENHRDVGRSRWWKCIQKVSSSSNDQTPSAPISGGGLPSWVENLDPEVRELLERGAQIKMVNLSGNATDSITAKKTIERVATENGLDFDIPFTFIPSAVALISKPR
ncbi:MAG: helix-turn-helix domain-containing protein [Candidatus Poseidoniaceae archaeon]|jgi:DNA-binding transcriptional ArsR family regulator|nr:helix-turn-helix domain-containing protein [Candidatus Poseidoniaceae archaeon]MDP7202627.1 helix-turn-helix domain-containing protein [Candidatus Poseidoniaceae archaeon]